MPPALTKFLIWTEKYTKTDMVYVFKNMSFLGGGQIVSAFITLAFAIFIADVLPKEEYGNYKYILTTVALINSIALSGLGPALVRAIAGGHDGTLEKFSKINFFWSFIPATILTIGSIYYYFNDNLLLSMGLLVGGLTLPFIERADLYSSILNGKKLFKILSVSSIIRNAIPTITIATIAYFTLNPLYMAIGYFISTSLILNFFYYYIYFKYIKNSKNRNSIDKEATHIAKHTSFINVFALVSDQIDNVLIFQFLGGAQLAIYNFAEAIPNVIQGIVKQLGVIATPKFVQNTTTNNLVEMKKNVIKKTFQSCFLLIPIIFLYWFVSPYIFQILFPKYMDSVFYSQLIVSILLIQGSIPVAFLDSQKAIKEKYILSLVSNIPKIPILIISCFYFGIIGLIFGRLVSKLIGFMASLILIKRI